MDKSDHDRYHRWRTSLHEAGHVAAIIVLARRHHEIPTLCGAMLVSGGGLAYGTYPAKENPCYPDGAIIAASGKHGEKLANRFRPPRLQEQPTAITPDTPPAKMSTETFKGFEQDHKEGAFDSDKVRDYCTRTKIGELWSRRYKEVHREARQIIRDHKREVIAIARLLYERGMVSSSEIAEIMPPLPLEDCI